ncbi:MAG TPA: hypothetical protein PK264_09775, partial [Hyphomicrobiaceae bacterium]|nr:hypothetical protein [Hyphomicrobiaceae bacterium]
IDRRTISLFIEAGHSAILSTAAPLPRFHAVLARSSGRMQAASLAVLRQLELLGAVSLNPADALSLLAEPIRRAQELARAGLAAPALAVSFTGAGRKGGDDRMVAAGGELSLPAQAGRKHLRFLVIAGAARAVMLRSDDALADDETAQAWLADEVSRYAEAGHAAKAAAQAFRLGVAAVDVDLSSATPLVTDISPAPTLALFERVAHIDAAGALIEAIEVAVAADVPLRSRASPSGGR